MPITESDTAKLAEFFDLKRTGSSVRTEVFAGLSTFLALSYIFVVNPAILSAGGMNKSAIFFATIVGSVTATLLMGLWANKPFAVAPGLEMNAYVAVSVIGVMGFGWADAMAAVFWSGILTVSLNYTRVRVRIIEAIPDTLKSGLAAAVGVFLILVAFKVAGMTAYRGSDITGIGNLASREAVLFYIGLALVLIIRYFKIPGAVLLSICGASVAAKLFGLSTPIEPITVNSDMFASILHLNLGIIANPKIWSVIIILFILDFYGSIAKFIGLTRNTSILSPDGTLPKLQEALTVDGLGTVLGASLGTSNLITYVESAVGIGEGGRTGLTAIVCGVLMSLFLFLTPLVNLVPVAATTGALFFVGTTLLPKKREWLSYHWVDAVAVLLMIVVTLWSFALDKAMFAGFAAVLLGTLVLKKRPNAYLVISTFVLLVSMLLSQLK
jgi:AGZA family xanthine/uracil permease-like MFS transporter